MKKAIVIGASSGIGREVARLLIKEGWTVGAAARREERLKELGAAAIEKIDVTQEDALEEGIELATMQTNAMGFTRMIGEAYRYFAEQGRGHIAAITSIAGTKGLGPAPSYSATKAMQNVYLQALEQQANSRGLKIRFTDIRPGFVDTALLDGDFRYPMMLKSESVARDILSAIHHHRHIQIIDWKYRLLTCLWRRIPRCLWRHLRI